MNLESGRAFANEPKESNPAAAFRYPEARQDDVVDDYHGTLIRDPYRWLEDPDAPETRDWIEAQNAITFGFLESIEARERLKERLTQLWDYEKYGVPYQRGGRYFFTKNDGLQNQSVLYTTEALDAEPRELLDPNKLSDDGTIALVGTAVSEDGTLLAYGLASAGSDWVEWKVRDVLTGEDRDDHLEWIKFSGASWTKDGQGFFYSRYPEPEPGAGLQQLNYYNTLYYHRIGTPQSEDELVYERPDQKEWMFSGDVTEDGRYLVISVRRSTEPKNLVLYKDLQDENAEIVELIDAFENEYSLISSDGPLFWFKTDRDAPLGRVIAIDITKPDPEHWTEIIPEAEETLDDVNMVHDQFIASYLKDAHSQVKIFDRKGRFVRAIELPDLGTAAGFPGRRTDTETFYVFTSFTQPGTIYRHDMTTGESTVFRRPEIGFNPDDYETKQVFYPSKDGTRIPMFISHRKGIELDGDNPTYLYGYGGFNIALTPSFSVANLVWMEMGGVYAVPNLRGGGEYGETWHKAGTKQSKQNVFDDFIAAAEWLIENGYTSPSKLALGGGSNGGLLVGACMTQRPELFAAVLPAVGVLDMLRFHKFTIGWAWVDDYGSSDNPEEFAFLYAYSPLHNLKPGTSYPATLITTADHDDRVVPAHSFKFAAALQAAHAGEAPTLIRIETRAGHGAGKPTAKIIEEAADRWAFLVRVLGIEEPEAR